MATSGTVNQYFFPVQKVIDHAMRRAGYTPQDIAGEWISVALDLLFLQLSEYVNVGFPLWTRQYLLLGCDIGSPDVPTPDGTVEVLHCYWRALMPYRGVATTTDAADASNLFGGQPNADITIAGPNPGVIVDFGSDTELDTVGVLLGGASALTASLQVQVSDDGTTWVTAQTLPSATYAVGKWTYFDLNPTLNATFVRLVSPGSASWVLNQLNFGQANGFDQMIGPLNIDDYYNLPDKMFRSQQPNSGFIDRQIAAPVIKIWPLLNVEAFYAGTITALVRRYIQDPGSMSNTLEIPSRWYEGVTARLGIRLMDELPMKPEADAQMRAAMMQDRAQRRTNLEGAATKAESLMWAEERSGGPLRLMPSLRAYTR